MKKTHIALFSAISIFAAAALGANDVAGAPATVVEAGKPVSLREATEWAHLWLPNIKKTDKPYVLLIGDSIANGYQGDVTRDLSSRAYVGYWISSFCVADPAYELMLKAVLTKAKFSVIHFNNGLHGVGYTEEQYGAGYEKALRLIHQMQPQAKTIVALATPANPSSDRAFLNPRVDKRNDEARKLAGTIGASIDDLNTSLRGHPELYRDALHYYAKTYASLAAKVVNAVVPLLPPTK